MLSYIKELRREKKRSMVGVISVAAVTFFSLIAIVANSALSSSSNRGASFNEAWTVVTILPKEASRGAIEDIREYGSEQMPTLPHYTFDLRTAFGLISAARRTVESSEDYRAYFRKLVHSNGICFAGKWEITEESKYSGYFKKGSSALMIGRISTATPDTKVGERRSFGFAGKLFPTTNPDEVVHTANFFTIQDLNGTYDRHALDVSFVNEPPVDESGLAGIPVLLVKVAFLAADSDPGVRPLYPISRAGQAVDDAVVTPRWMRIRVQPELKNPAANDSDFRDELSAKNYPNGLAFTIEVSDVTKDPNVDAGWTRIGQIQTSPMNVSFGCDRRLHFHHQTFVDPQAK